MLISEIFMKQGRHVLHQSNRKKSLDNGHNEEKKDPSLMESAKLQPLDLNFIQNHPQKAEYSMIV